MARSEITTLLPLDRYAEIMRLYPPHFNQLNGNKAPIVKGTKDTIWDQQARDILAWTMAQAEEMIAIELGYYPAPKYFTNEQIAFGLRGTRYDWTNAEVATQWSYVESFGTEQLTLLAANVAVTYSVSDSNPFNRENLATVGDGSILCSNACDVAVFFRVADGAEDAADERWEIRPLKVDLDAATMTITGNASLFVKPSLWELTEQESEGSVDDIAWIIDYDTANFVTAVDVYCRTTNTTLPLTLQWDGICDCTSPCSHSTQTACAYRTDNQRGYFVPRPASGANVWATPLYAFPPESVLTNYRAGYPLKNCRMNPNLERAIVKLTNALLPEPPCGYSDPGKAMWDQDRKNIDPLTPEAVSLPWDIYKQGALEAWRIVKLMRRGKGGKIGR